MTVWLWSINRLLTKKLEWYDIALSIAVDYFFFIQMLLFQYSSNEEAIGTTPMFSYIFLLIVMRSLHLQPGQVVFSGVCASVSWGIMVYVTLVATGILAHYGAVGSSSTYAADALKSIEEILFKTELWQSERRELGLPTVDLRAACSVGDVVFGAVGGGGRMEFTIIGDAVNTTAKLEKYTKIVGAKSLVTSRAFETAKAQGYSPQCKIDRFSNQTIPGLTRKVDLVAISKPEGASFAHLLKSKAKAS